MINISDNSILHQVRMADYRSFQVLMGKSNYRWPLYVTIGLMMLMIAGMFLPWTQNIQGKGYVTTLQPGQKPQAIQSVISGRIEKWYVREGDRVNAGDTILFISEVRSEYFDPELVERTAEQLAATASAAEAYGEKAGSLGSQYQALLDARDFKLRQVQNKVLQARNRIVADSIELVAYEAQQSIAGQQLKRAQELYDKGLRSLTELETARLKWQDAQARYVSQQNKLLIQRNELLNLQIETSALESEFADKLAKSRADKFTAESDQFKAIASASKLRNEYTNYQERLQFYYITAPQSGFVTKALQSGIGELVREGTDIVTIMPAAYELAVEMYVRPNDLPLLRLGDKARIQFDGWPALVLRGWPNLSTGTFPGEIFAIDQFISENGLYRILIRPAEDDKAWPELLRVGAGTRTFILLRDVPVWYEVWRQLNGFPPDFYRTDEERKMDVNPKPPIKSVK